jgi:hypothetical protein
VILGQAVTTGCSKCGSGNVRALKLRRKRQWNPFPYATPVVCLECGFYENFRARGDNENGEQFREAHLSGVIGPNS